ncbi:MAG: hypothetical protein RL235_621, partial [Chlamydiota bacterium]
LENTLAHPIVHGAVVWKEGTYQNELTGMQLFQINGGATFHGDRLTLDHFSAVGKDMAGQFTMNGSMLMQLQNALPYRFEFRLDHLVVAEIELVSTVVSGNGVLQGNLHQGKVSGHFAVNEGYVSIPHQTPKTVPNLQVVYRHASKPTLTKPLATVSTYPLHFDVSADAPSTILIEGRGLQSQWKGYCSLQGVAEAPEFRGSVELVKGEFSYGGRTFRLTDGTITFGGKPKEMPELNIAGSMLIKDVTIIARLKGPLNQPQLTLQSNPPLPMGSIIAYLLFGENVSEINSFEALQIASAISDLAGEGPGILEKTRRTLGVDRLRIVSVPCGPEGESDALAIQVGKYVAEGVIVTFTQGAEESSGSIGVEVELKHGFSFQIESDQLQEQGIFSIKWNTTY